MNLTAARDVDLRLWVERPAAGSDRGRTTERPAPGNLATMTRPQLAALFAAAALAALTAGADAQAPETRTITLASPFDSGRSAEVDLGRKGFSPGDVYTTTGERLVDPSSGERVGSSDGVSTVVGRAAKGTMAMTGTIRLADGTILLQGILRHGDAKQSLPITGGTGAYEGARGSVTVRSEMKKERNVWEVRLLGG